MEILWQLGPASVHQVRNQLAKKKKLAYTTVLTALQKLEKAGWIKHRPEGNSYIYCPTLTRPQATATSLLHFIKQVFNGDAVVMFQHLIDQSNLKDDELLKLKKMIDKKRKECTK